MTSLLLALQLSAFSVPLSAFSVPPSAFDVPDAATSAAVAVGLAMAERTSIEAAMSVEVAGPPPSANSEPIEWIRTCDPYGCRLVPRASVPGGVRPAAEQAAPQPKPMPFSDEEEVNAVEPCGRHVRRLLFGRWR